MERRGLTTHQSVLALFPFKLRLFGCRLRSEVLAGSSGVVGKEVALDEVVGGYFKRLDLPLPRNIITFYCEGSVTKEAYTLILCTVHTV